MRVQMAMKFVAKMNLYSCQKAGGYKAAPSIPAVMGMSCLMCVTRGTCLGNSCLGNNGKFRIYHHTLSYHLNFSVLPKASSIPNIICSSTEYFGGKIPGCQTNSLDKSRKRKKTSRFVFWSSYQTISHHFFTGISV